MSYIDKSICRNIAGQINMRLQKQTQVYICIKTFIFTHTQIYICVFVCTWIHVHTYVYI